MKKKIIALIAIVVILIVSFLIGTGFMKNPNVVLGSYSISEDGSVITLNAGVATSMGYIRGYKDNGGGVKPHYLTFYSTFGGLNSSFGSKNTFTLELAPNDTEIYFNRADGGYELVLVKDEETAQWIRPTELNNQQNQVANEETEKWDMIPMVMVDGKLYLTTGYESTVEARCGVMDGEITSEVDGSEKPTENNQSNFGTGFGYQYGSREGTIEIYMNEKWWIFATEEVRQQIQFPEENNIDDWGVTLTADNITPTSLNLKCTQSDGKPTGELQTGSWYVLEIWTQENGWKEVDYLPQEYVLTWTQEAWMIPMNDTCEWEVNWEWLYGQLPEGKYRIGKEITDFRDTGDYDVAVYYAEFEIVEK